MTAILILYEDSRAGSGSFAPHDLLMALVADQRETDVRSIKQRVKELPLNGVGNLLKALSQPERLAKLAPGGGRILAIVDDDKIREHLKAPASATSSQVEKLIKQRCAEPSRLTVVLLEHNVESLIKAVRKCDKKGVLSRAQIDAALNKDLNARDLVLGKVALDPDRRSLRDCVRREVPSLEKAIDTVVAALVA